MQEILFLSFFRLFSFSFLEIIAERLQKWYISSSSTKWIIIEKSRLIILYFFFFSNISYRTIVLSSYMIIVPLCRTINSIRKLSYRSVTSKSPFPRFFVKRSWHLTIWNFKYNREHRLKNIYIYFRFFRKLTMNIFNRTMKLPRISIFTKIGNISSRTEN